LSTPGCFTHWSIVRKYQTLKLGYVDAIVVALAERLGEATIATLDRRHFGVIRPEHAPAFRLIP
jgi:hypothetical protein